MFIRTKSALINADRVMVFHIEYDGKCFWDSKDKEDKWVICVCSGAASKISRYEGENIINVKTRKEADDILDKICTAINNECKLLDLSEYGI